MDTDDLVRADRDLLAAVDGRLAAAAERAGKHLVCRPGCTECCIGPFPINALDARRLRRGLERLAERRPERAAAVVERARGAVRRLADGFPGDPASGRLHGDEEAEEHFFARWAVLPCPVLDPATGRCELYAHRPLACRTYGPPVTIGGERLPPCRLCFRGASDAAVEACCVEPDPEGLEDGLLDALETAGEDGETLIAWAIAAGLSHPGLTP